MRTTVNLSAEAYQIAQAVARDRNKSLSQAINDIVTGAYEPRISNGISDENGFPTFLCERRVTSEDVRQILDDE